MWTDHLDGERAFMALGYAGNDGWTDMSEYLVHLTGRAHPVGLPAAPMEGILRTSRLEARTPVGAVRRHPTLGPTQHRVSLSEIPLDHLRRLGERRGTFGVGFTKTTISQLGGAPVWYLERGSKLQQMLFDRVRDLAYLSAPDPDDWLWQLTPYIDYPGEYPDAPFGPTTYRFEWEREWRVPSFPFGPDAVEFLVAPSDHHVALGGTWSSTFSGTEVPPILDLAWSLDELQVWAEASGL